MRSCTATTLYVCPADKCSFSTPPFWLRALGHSGAPIAQANYLLVNGSSIVEIKFDKRRFRECLRERSQSSKSFSALSKHTLYIVMISFRTLKQLITVYVGLIHGYCSTLARSAFSFPTLTFSFQFLLRTSIPRISPLSLPAPLPKQIKVSSKKINEKTALSSLFDRSSSSQDPIK